MSSARTWLEPRLASAPEELATAIRACLERGAIGDAEAVPEALARAALAELDAVLQGGHGRETALRLLAADALLTYAFEAAAERGSHLQELADRLGPAGALGRRLVAALAAEQAAEAHDG